MENNFDDIYAQLANRSGGIEPLLDSFFGFLSRRTDFYVQLEEGQSSSMGFPKGAAMGMVQKAFSKYPLRMVDNSAPTIPESAQGKKDCSRLSAKSYMSKENELQVPIGNGGIGPNYYWTQSLQDLSVYIDVPLGCSSKDVTCQISARKVRLAVRGDVLLDGEFEDLIRAEDSMWTICISEGVPQVVLSLDKSRQTWWKSVLLGHPEIDTSLVDSTQRVSDYDESTQAAIRKIVAQQRDKALIEDLAGLDTVP